MGDALGARVEGQPGPARLEEEGPWSVTDDTQLTLATCEAMWLSGTVVAEDVARRYLSWFRRGELTGLGASTLKALMDLDAGAHWALSGARGEAAAGNGAAMRAAPLAFLLDPASEADRRVLRDVARITHHHEEAYAGALAIVVAVRAALDGTWPSRANLPAVVAPLVPDSRVRDALLALATVPPTASLEDISREHGCSGFVAESVPLAIFAAQRAPVIGFAEMVRSVIAIGGDTDTNASMAGQLAGALLGRDALPPAWLQRLPEKPPILSIADRFERFVAETEAAGP